MIRKIRFWLIRRIAGKMPVVLNTKVQTFALTAIQIEGGVEGALVADCEFQAFPRVLGM